MKLEIGISMNIWEDEERNELPVYSVTLNVTGEYGCTSPWEKSLYEALCWCADAVYEMTNDSFEYYAVLNQLSRMFPNEGVFDLPF